LIEHSVADAISGKRDGGGALLGPRGLRVRLERLERLGGARDGSGANRYGDHANDARRLLPFA
jgi:hypothetical protein